jgi:hypothetical protein
MSVVEDHPEVPLGRLARGGFAGDVCGDAGDDDRIDPLDLRISSRSVAWKAP